MQPFLETSLKILVNVVALGTRWARIVPLSQFQIRTLRQTLFHEPAMRFSSYKLRNSDSVRTSTMRKPSRCSSRILCSSEFGSGFCPGIQPNPLARFISRFAMSCRAFSAAAGEIRDFWLSGCSCDSTPSPEVEKYSPTSPRDCTHGKSFLYGSSASKSEARRWPGG